MAPMKDQLELLIEPFRSGVLPHLPAGALARLRCTCRLLQEVVDYHTGPSWFQAASQLIESAIVPEAQHGLPVQRTLWTQGRIVAQLLSGLVYLQIQQSIPVSLLYLVILVIRHVRYSAGGP